MNIEATEALELARLQKIMREQNINSKHEDTLLFICQTFERETTTAVYDGKAHKALSSSKGTKDWEILKDIDSDYMDLILNRFTFDNRHKIAEEKQAPLCVKSARYCNYMNAAFPC